MPIAVMICSTNKASGLYIIGKPRSANVYWRGELKVMKLSLKKRKMTESLIPLHPRPDQRNL